MRRFSVEAPARLPAPSTSGLGRLGGPLRWLASAQGAWPPQRPELRALDADADTDVGTGTRTEAADGPDQPDGPDRADAADAADAAAAADAALERGVAQADAAADAAVGLVLVESTASAGPGLAAIGALLRLEPVAAVGTAGGPDWAALLGEVRAGLLRARPHVADPAGLLAALDDPALTRLTGVLAQCAVRRTPVVLGSSSVVAAAALVAERLAPGARAWWLAGDTPATPGGQRALADLALTPLLDLQLPTGGAAPAAQVLLAGVDLAAGTDG